MSTSNTQHDLALDAIRAVVGEPHVHRSPDALGHYARTTGTTGTTPTAIVCPESTEQVQRIVRIAARHRLPLYPISRGRNFGYGDANAPTPGQVIVDMQRMNRIVTVNDDLAYCVIEPGVTQGQLADHLQQHFPDLMMDCTGAGRDASLVGNTLDRGFGHTPYGDHFLHTCGMKVVLADGSVLDTGFDAFANARSGRVYRYGVGPFLDGLFCQSNCGIVTEIGLWLMPRPEAFCAFFFSVDREDDLERVVGRLAPLRRSDILKSAIHIGNDLRILSSKLTYPYDRTDGQMPLPDAVRCQLRQEHGLGLWMGAGSIEGPADIVKATKRQIRKALAPIKPIFIDEKRYARANSLVSLLNRFGIAQSLAGRLAAIRPALDLMQGIPTDEPLGGACWRLPQPLEPDFNDPLDTDAGLMWVSPVLPMTGEDVRRVVDLVEPIYARHGFECPITFTLINQRAIIAITNIFFDKSDPTQAAAAEACYDELITALIQAGYPPYRTGPRCYPKLQKHAPELFQLSGRIKSLLDPQNILSPGRYIEPAPAKTPQSAPSTPINTD